MPQGWRSEQCQSMAEIDLIPDDYRRRVQQQSLLRRYAAVLITLNVVIAVVAFGFNRSVQSAQREASDLRTANAMSEQQQGQLEQLRTQREEFEQQWSLLRGLRAGAEVEDIFELIDRSLVGDRLWFSEWSFRRAGVVTDGRPRGRETGYFVLVDEQNQDADPALKVETHMEISGQARDHQALSTFVRNLFEQSDVKDVSVQRTSQSSIGSQRIVEFDVTVILNSDARSSG